MIINKYYNTDLSFGVKDATTCYLL